MKEFEVDPGPTCQPVRLKGAMGPAVLVRQDTTLRDVARVMLEQHADNVVVVNADGAVRGVITDRDLTLKQSTLRLAAVKVPRVNGHWVTPSDAVDAACVAAMTITAEEVMDSRLTTANELEPIGTVVERMVRRDVDHVVVLQDGNVVGLLGRRDLLRLVGGQPQAQPVSTSNSGTVQHPTAHVALHRGGLSLAGWLLQVLR